MVGAVFSRVTVWFGSTGGSGGLRQRKGVGARRCVWRLVNAVHPTYNAPLSCVARLRHGVSLWSGAFLKHCAPTKNGAPLRSGAFWKHSASAVAVWLMLCGVGAIKPVYAQKAEQETPPAITVRASAGIQPYEQHTTRDMVAREPGTGFSVGADIGYRLPIDGFHADVGIGGAWFIERSLATEHGYSTVPVYGYIGLPFNLPDDTFFTLYVDARLGYSFFLPSESYRQQYLDGATPSGAIYFGAGLATEFLIVEHWKPFVQIVYETAGGTVDSTALSTTILNAVVGIKWEAQ